MTDSYIAIDLETTGLNPKTERILEVGAVKVEHGVRVAEYSTFVNPRRSIAERITELTGITGDMVENCPDIGEILPEILEFCGELPLLGHNILFDYSFLKRAAVNRGYWFERQGIDTLMICRKFMPETEKKNLGAACDFYGIEMGKAHRALSDALAACSLYEKLKALYGEKEPEPFQPHLLNYKVKREQPGTKRQKEVLRDLLKYHKITLSAQIDDLSRNEISRITDKIISKYGRIL